MARVIRFGERLTREQRQASWRAGWEARALREAINAASKAPQAVSGAQDPAADAQPRRAPRI